MQMLWVNHRYEGARVYPLPWQPHVHMTKKQWLECLSSSCVNTFYSLFEVTQFWDGENKPLLVGLTTVNNLLTGM